LPRDNYSRIRMAMDFSSILQSAPQMFRDLPFLLNLTQFIFYAGIAFTLGGIVMRAYKGQLSSLARLIGRTVFGFLVVVTGFGISWAIPVLTDVPIYSIAQSLFINVILGSLISTAILFLAIRLVSYHIYNIRGIQSGIENLKKRLKKAREVETKEKKEGRQGIRNPVRIAGLVILAAFIIIGLSGFRGFPNPMEEIGLDPDDLNDMADQMDTINEQYGDTIADVLENPDMVQECMGAVSLLDDMNALEQARPYQSTAVQRMIEDYTGEPVIEMYGLDTDSGFYVFSISGTQACISSVNVVCACHDMEEALNSI
jgi:hypothetical protein